jgi:hypothetical protein
MEDKRIATWMVWRDLENTKRACDAQGFDVVDPDTTPLPDGDGGETLI